MLFFDDDNKRYNILTHARVKYCGGGHRGGHRGGRCWRGLARSAGAEKTPGSHWMRARWTVTWTRTTAAIPDLKLCYAHVPWGLDRLGHQRFRAAPLPYCFKSIPGSSRPIRWSVSLHRHRRRRGPFCPRRDQAASTPNLGPSRSEHASTCGRRGSRRTISSRTWHQDASHGMRGALAPSTRN